MFVISVPHARRRIATSWRPAWSTTSIAGSASSCATGVTSTSSSGSISEMRGPVGAAVVDRDLHQAQQRPVAALGHELGVDPDPAARARATAAAAATSSEFASGPEVSRIVCMPINGDYRGRRARDLVRTGPRGPMDAELAESGSGLAGVDCRRAGCRAKRGPIRPPW